MAKTKALPTPQFFNPANAADFNYRADQLALFGAATAWKAQHDLKPVGSDKTKIHLLLIDVQKDFCFPQGTLYVGGRSGKGALEDNQRTAEFIYRNLGVLTKITTTLDTHFAYQIFFPWFWIDKDGASLAPFRTISTAETKSGSVRPNPLVAHLVCGGNYPWLQKQVQFYCEELEKAGKYMLYLWPPHCLLGDVGHALVGVIHEARMFHAFTRGSQSECEVKGGHPLTENYSVLSPEVLLRWDGKGTLGQRNTAFIQTLLEEDAVIIGGQAASHCVKSSIEDLLDSIVAQDPALAKKVYVVEDLMSSVAIPDRKGGFIADFTPQAEAALDKFRNAGMNVVKSTDPIESWPGIQL